MPDFIYLASQSPRRRQLLEQIGVAHQLLLPAAHEDSEALEAILPAEAPADYVQRVTRSKSQAAWQRWQAQGLPPAPILCADTTVALGGRILGKPADAAQAQAMLQMLSGQQHQVLPAVVLLSPQSGRQLACCNVSQVLFDVLDATDIAAYIASGEPFGKAGSYGIQGLAARFIKRIEGSYSAIMGLPLFEVAHMLRQLPPCD